MEKLSFRYKHLKIAYQFSAVAPYHEGHQLSAGEARALNQLRVENIRENMRKSFTEIARGTTEGVLPPEDIRRVQQAIDSYDLSYQFPHILESPERLGAIEREARMLATARSAEGTPEAEVALLAESIDLVS